MEIEFTYGALSAQVTVTTDTGSGTPSRLYLYTSGTAGSGESYIDGLQFKGEVRFAVAPDINYRCEVRAGDTVKSFEFRTKKKFGQFDSTSAVEKFGCARAGAVYACPCAAVGVTELPPVDAAQPLSPYFDVKTFAELRKPSFDQIKALLPVPVLSAEDKYLADAYYYAWSVAFGEWLIDPPDKSQSVFYMCGCPDWAGQGSSVDYDSAFIMMFAKYAYGVFPYIRTLDNIYARQHENGFIIKEGTANNFEVYSSSPAWAVTAYLAWTEYEYYKLSGDLSRIESVFLPLVKFYEWFRTYMEKCDGTHPSVQAGHGDWGVANEAAMLIFDEKLAEIASLCKREDMSRYFISQAESARTYINAALWDEENGVYSSLIGGKYSSDYHGGNYRFIRSFDVLATDHVPSERARQMVNALLDPEKFRGKYGVRSLSSDSDYYMTDTDNMITADYMAEKFPFDFRRTVWPPNLVFALAALDRYGRESDADILGEDYCRAVAAAYAQTGDIWEHSWDDKIAPGGHRSFCGWSGYGAVACLIERVIGLKIEVEPSGLYRVNWDLRYHGRHGVNNLRFGGVTASFLGEPGERSAWKITVTSTSGFILILKLNEDRHILNIGEGDNCFYI